MSAWHGWKEVGCSWWLYSGALYLPQEAEGLLAVLSPNVELCLCCLTALSLHFPPERGVHGIPRGQHVIPLGKGQKHRTFDKWKDNQDLSQGLGLEINFVFCFEARFHCIATKGF